MPFRIQRVPQGLNNLLSIFGGGTPVDLEDRVQGTLELVQFYALQQARVFFQNNAAVAELGTVNAVAAADAAIMNQWAVLFGANCTIVKTATATALSGSIRLLRNGAANSITLEARNLGPFGATETGPVIVPFWAPYPIILRPPWNVFARLDLLGTDATADVTAIAEIGILQ